MIELLIRHVGVVAFAVILARLLRPASAAVRHALWTAALLICALLPVLSQLRVDLPASLSSVNPFESTAVMVGAEAGAEGAELASKAPDSAALPTWGELAWTLYFIVAGGLLLRWATGWLRAVWLAKRGQPMGEFHGASVVAVAGVGPMTFGWPRATIVLPGPELRHRELVLRHELAHVRRADFLWQALGALACAVWWFSPAVWLAQRAMRSEAERACDDAVLRAGASPTSYAGCLLEIASMKNGSVASAAPMAHQGSGSGLAGRISAILSRSTDRRAAGPIASLGLLALLLPAGVFVAPAVPAATAGVPVSLDGRRILLDAGHGGRDPGAVSVNLQEADVNLAIVHKAAQLLRDAGASVTLTREGNQLLDLRSRAALAADQDLLISVHVGALSGSATASRSFPMRVYYYGKADTPLPVGAQDFASGLAAAVGSANDLAVDSRIVAARFIVLGTPGATSLLVELGNMAEADDRAKLRDPVFQQAVASGLVDAVKSLATAGGM